MFKYQPSRAPTQECEWTLVCESCRCGTDATNVKLGEGTLEECKQLAIAERTNHDSPGRDYMSWRDSSSSCQLSPNLNCESAPDLESETNSFWSLYRVHCWTKSPTLEPTLEPTANPTINPTIPPTTSVNILSHFSTFLKGNQFLVQTTTPNPL